MKKGEQPELSAKWWKGSQPKGLKSAGKLDDALKGYETARRKLEQGGDAAAGQAAMGALDDIVAAAKAVLAEAGKAKGAPEMEWTADAMKKLDREISAERKFVADHAEEDDDGQFSDPDVYHTYLVSALKRLRTSGQMNFGVVLGKKAEDHRLALHKSKGAKALAGMVARETGLRIMSFGVAMTPKVAGEAEAAESESEDGEGMGDEKSSTLILSLEGRQLPGLKKKLTKMLKKFKPLPFKSVQLMVGGAEVSDIDDPEDADLDDEDVAPDPAALARALAALVGQVKDVTDAARKGDLARMATRAGALLRGGDLSGAETAIAALGDALKTRSGAATGNGAANGAGAAAADRADAYGRSGRAWVATRSRVQTDLDKLRAALVASYQDDGIADEIESRFRSRVAPVMQGLDASLAEKLEQASGAADAQTRAARVAEAQAILQRCQAFIDGEPLLADLDANPFVPLEIRKTLTATLSALERAVH